MSRTDPITAEADLARKLSRAIAAALCAILVACGGGGNAGEEPVITPAITGRLLAFLPGEAPTDPALGGHNATALVLVRDGNGAMIDDVTVAVNGIALAYDPAQTGFAAPLSVQPGGTVQLSVQIGQSSYSATATLPLDAPVITTPLDNQGWAADEVHRMQWNATTRPQSVQYLGLLVADSWNRVRPILELGADTRSFDFQANQLQSGDYTLLVGAGDPVVIPRALPGSGFVVATAGRRDVRVRYGVANVTGMTVSGIPTPALLLKSTEKELRAGALTGPGSITTDVSIISQWQSSDPGVVSVTYDGLITALSAGSAVISVTYRGHTAALPVRVFDPGPWSGGPTRTHSVAYQADHGHSGHVTLGGMQPALPLQDRWTVDLGGEVFYPLVADGRVFVITRGPALFTGAHVRALDVATGDLLWGPISIPGTINIAYHAYHAGKVFVTGADGVVLAFDAATGAKLWETDLQDSYDIEAPPVAIDGLVYVLAFQGSSTLFAIDQEQGHVLWKSFLPLGIRGSPAVDAEGVYLTNQGRVHKLDRLTGEVIWSTLGQYGLDTTPVRAGSRLWIRYTSSPLVTGVAPNAAMNPEDGSVLGTFPGLGMPAVAAGYSYHVVEGRLVSLQVATQQQRWEFAGDGQLLAPALVIDDYIVVASRAGKVYMLAAATGTEVWSDDTPPPIEVWDEHRSSMGVGSGYMLVPGGTTLTGWKLVAQP